MMWQTASRPPKIGKGPTDVLVAIFSHEKTTLDNIDEKKDFTWFKCNKKHTIAKLKDFYGKRVNRKVDLFWGASTPNDKLLVWTLDSYFSDGIVAIRAVEVKINDSQGSDTSRTPLKTVNSQVTVLTKDVESPTEPVKSSSALTSLFGRFAVKKPSASQFQIAPQTVTKSSESSADPNTLWDIPVAEVNHQYPKDHLDHVNSMIERSSVAEESDNIKIIRSKWDITPEGPILKPTGHERRHTAEELDLFQRILLTVPGMSESREMTAVREKWRLSPTGPIVRDASHPYSKEQAAEDIIFNNYNRLLYYDTQAVNPTKESRQDQVLNPLQISRQRTDSLLNNQQPVIYQNERQATTRPDQLHYETLNQQTPQCETTHQKEIHTAVQNGVVQPGDVDYSEWNRQNYRLSPQGPLKKNHVTSVNYSPYSALERAAIGSIITPHAEKYPMALNNGTASGIALPEPAPTLSLPPPLPLPKPSASYLRLQRVLAEGSPEELEAEVQSSLSILERLKVPMSNLTEPSQEAQQWLQQIEILKKQNINEPTIIGVVGNTGAGKSSVINAMLDEERLVPTNCMRACTAVVTEMSWNSCNEENEKYRADIEFIRPEDWEKELGILFAELLDGSGKISREATMDSDSEAGVAYAKIRAVYPNKTRDEIAQSSIEQLMREPVVRHVLGTTDQIKEARPDTFYKRLQHYVDSREKQADDKKRDVEFWPLIKVVKIYTKSDALSTGAVIVDLPGVMDSNAARGNVAKTYMKKCTGLWIVAPINRAVDDRAAHNLMGDAFKRQLKYDGTYSRVTFICSKTDDISVTEASESLGLEEQMSTSWDKIDVIERDQKRLEKDLKELKESKAVFYDVLTDTDDQLEVWDKLKEELEDGKDVFPPGESSKKRKRGSSPNKSRKKRAASNSSDDDDFAQSSDHDESQVLNCSQNVEPLTMDTIDNKISELKDTKKEARKQRKDIDSKMTVIRDELKTLQAQHDEINAEMSIICISGRNDYSKGAIQRDFASGIKELDHEAAAETDEASFNPDEDLRDYDEVARSLPVFCVSSRAYQKLSGRLKKDKAVPGFTELAQTEVPQLQVHCKKLTEAGRLSTCRRFLNAFSQLVNSMNIWSSNDGSGISLSDDQVATEARFLKSRLAQLEKELERAVTACLEEMKTSLAENIYDHFQTAIDAAVNDANDTAAKWGAPVNRDNRGAGGLYWSTYKAICRRDGVYSNAQGPIDFNNELSEPMIKKLGSFWETAFVRRLPKVLQSFTKNIKELLKAFHESVEARVMKSGVGIAGLAMLGQQLQNYENIFQDLSGQMLDVINEQQRDASREFVPVVGRNLLSAYLYCTNERGSGSYMRMKSHMTSHVDTQRTTMFKAATSEVKDRLNHMCRVVKEQMSNKSDHIFVLMQRDYAQAITGSHIPQGYLMPKWERSMKAGVTRILNPEDPDTNRRDGEEPATELETGGDVKFAAVETTSGVRSNTGVEAKAERNLKDEMDIDRPLHSIPEVKAAVVKDEDVSPISPASSKPGVVKEEF